MSLRMINPIGILFRRERLLLPRQMKPIPDVDQSFGKAIDQDVIMIG